MDQVIAAEGPRFQTPIARRMAYSILVAMIAGYLGVITYSFHGRLATTRGVLQIAVLWCLSVVALALLVRSWRRVRLLAGH